VKKFAKVVGSANNKVEYMCKLMLKEKPVKIIQRARNKEKYVFYKITIMMQTI
jgi:hypothetical protein